MKCSCLIEFSAIGVQLFEYVRVVVCMQPPVIRLYDLMVRTNVSVKSGVQLLLVEQSSTPEMYKLDFTDKKMAKA